MADDDVAGGSGFLDGLLAKAKQVSGQVREFAADTFDNVKEAGVAAGGNLKDFAADAGGNLKDFATDAGGNLKGFASDAVGRGQHAFETIKQRLEGRPGDPPSADAEE